ncbi:glycerol kinase [Gluconacetobacter diazotrophicus PA1 5]|uniref:Glycerol kinase n=2 Tax=Gluconacetobacter diazotrophicus TaxID=33996 RepID=A9H2W4_GLUDA|nr:glycerol kinase GlpK [Gluconacetobacter diazotrophicus]ACI52085.1 glycerol kinase [Gluconacetobacter diazotrophicus PA1 5]MBB2156959.1 glycerol kinase GlpK [Gluconacetobacter diazotrophicus]TWB02794.1 glycerol kinase [Gluconacetobacter diazotrophicus]CAP54209.1 putative glycerol kinase [Gluconacetobacter diazotrophicus PA1 5]
MTSYVGAIDQGTTSSRFIIFDRQGRIASVAQKEHRQIYPRPGWVEHDPVEIMNNTNEMIGAALARANLAAEDLAAVGITNQRETTVLWDRETGRPLHNALVWQDTRVDQLVTTFAADGGQDRFRQVTGLPLASYFAGLKLRWLLDNVDGARAKAEAGQALFGTIDSWVIWNLTGGPNGGIHVTDVTNASRTQLMNLETCDWDRGMLDVFAIPAACLPKIVPSSFVYGEIATPTLKGTKIAGILGDQQAALVGQTCFSPGEAKNTYGTGSFLLMNTGVKPVQSKAGLLTTLAYQFGEERPCYALEGAIAITGALVQWLRDNLKLFDIATQIEPLARSVEDNGGIYIVPAFSGLYAPYWKENARGVIAGLTRYVTRAHFARAALESTAYQVRDVVEAMESDSGIRLTSLKTDGGMVANELLMQFQADILNVPVVRPKVVETTALGAAYAAGLAVGYWSNTDDLRANWEIDKTWTPSMPEDRRAHYTKSWKKAVQRSFDWVD